MKKSKDLIGSPVISIADGMQVGEVKSLVIEPKAKRVEFFILSENEEDVIKAIPFARAEAVGDYAVTIGQMADILDLKSINVAQHLLENECKIIGAKVISNKGQLLGVVVEYGINPDTGEITTYFYNNDNEEGKEESEQSLDAEQVITIGRDMIIVQDNAASNKKPNWDEKQHKKAADPVKDNVEEDLNKAAEPVFFGPAVDRREVSEDPNAAFVQRQREFVIGKSLLKDFKTDEGEVIARESDIVTEEIFNAVVSLGTQKLMELAMSVRE